MIDDIKKIISDGVLAPSGENCQPWRFIIKNDKLFIFNIPEADKSLYNFKQKGSYVAHGALLENISISAAHYEYIANIEIFPSKAEENLVSVVSFQKTKSPSESLLNLYPYLKKRCTNRKDHKPVKLSDQNKIVLIKTAQDTHWGELKIIDDQASLGILGRDLAVNERVLFENKSLHDFFYEHVFWNKNDEGKAGGFYVETLEFLPHQLKAVKIFRNWLILNFLNRFGGVSKKIAKENGEKYARSGALAAIVVKGKTPTDFINAGRVAERVWLFATKLNLSVQPCTGVLYFMERLRDGDTTTFSIEHSKLIRNAYNNIVKIFDLKDQVIPMLFRLGYSDAPTARAARIIPDISVE